jgi:hypothetical protein
MSRPEKPLQLFYKEVQSTEADGGVDTEKGKRAAAAIYGQYSPELRQGLTVQQQGQRRSKDRQR